MLLSAPVLSAHAAGDPAYAPGHRFVRTYLEDNRNVGAIGVDLGWNAFWNDELIVAPSTGFRLIQRHQTEQPIFGWTASLQLAGTTPVAPVLEFGFDAGKSFGDHVIDRLRRDETEKHWIDPDTYAMAGLQFTLSPEWTATAYYKVHYIREADNKRLNGTEVLGVSLTRRFARQRLLWWQVPL